MKKLIKFFTITGLVILVSGIGITSAAASMGGSLPRHSMELQTAPPPYKISLVLLGPFSRP